MAVASSALIVGASRGLGLGLAHEYLKRGWRVIATARDPHAPALVELQARSNGALTIGTVDIASPDQIAGLRRRLAGEKLDLLFVNAGVTNNPNEKIGEVSTEEFVRVMTTNALGPMRVVESLIGLVRPDGVAAVMSSGLGSVADNEGGGWEVYRASKAALNTLMKSFAARHAGDGRTYLVVAPGWARTDMGGRSGAPFRRDKRARRRRDNSRAPRRRRRDLCRLSQQDRQVVSERFSSQAICHLGFIAKDCVSAPERAADLLAAFFPPEGLSMACRRRRRAYPPSVAASTPFRATTRPRRMTSARGG